MIYYIIEVFRRCLNLKFYSKRKFFEIIFLFISLFYILINIFIVYLFLENWNRKIDDKLSRKKNR